MRKDLIFFSIVILVSSCKQKGIHFEENKALYINSVKCLNSQYGAFFDGGNLNSTISIYVQDLQKYRLCNDIVELFAKENIDFIDYQKDSTIGFYFKELKGLRSIQPVLIYFKAETFSKKFGTDYKVVKINDKNWYETERNISIAN